VDTTAPPSALGSPGGRPPSGRASKKRKAGGEYTPLDELQRTTARLFMERSRSGQKLSDLHKRYLKDGGHLNSPSWKREIFLGATTSKPVRIARVMRGWTAEEAYTGLPAEPVGRPRLGPAEAARVVEAAASPAGMADWGSSAPSTPVGQNSPTGAFTFPSEEARREYLRVVQEGSDKKRKLMADHRQHLERKTEVAAEGIRVATEGIRVAEETAVEHGEITAWEIEEIDRCKEETLEALTSPVGTPSAAAAAAGLHPRGLAFEDEDEDEGG
jgi:hypothetical protein